MAEHTPGPWEVAPDGLHVKTIHGSPFMDESELMPCRISPGVNGKANARLIAAAPDLLASCQRALNVFGSFEVSESPTEEEGIKFDVVCHLVFAIAKATGKEPS